MTRIIIASWMLAVVGAAMIVSGWYIYKYINDDDDDDCDSYMLVIAFCWATVIGICLFMFGILPYIPDITLPCITVIP